MNKLYFLLLCIPARILLLLISQWLPSEYLKWYGLVLLTISIGFLYLYFNNLRLNAPEANGNTWWADYRLIIGLLYLGSAIYSFQGKKILIMIPLAIDIILGLFLFIKKHYI